MEQDLLQKALAALEDRELVLAESIVRIVLMLPENGRVNVAVKRADLSMDVATLYLTPEKGVECRLSDEPPYNVVTLRPSN